MLFQPASNILVPFMQPQFRRGRASGGGGGLAAFSYDFTGTDGAEWDAAKFTELNGSVNILSNTGRFVTGSFGLDASLYSGGNTTSANQYQRFLMVTIPSNSFPHFGFRYSGSGNAFYTIEVTPTSAQVAWYYWANLAAFIAGSGTTIQSGVSLGPGTLTANDAIAITMDDTGNNTTVRVWLNPTGGATVPTSAADWGGDNTPSATLTNDPATAVDSGGGLFLSCFQNTANATQLDGWFGGDTPP